MALLAVLEGVRDDVPEGCRQRLSQFVWQLLAVRVKDELLVVPVVQRRVRVGGELEDGVGYVRVGPGVDPIWAAEDVLVVGWCGRGRRWSCMSTVYPRPSDWHICSGLASGFPSSPDAPVRAGSTYPASNPIPGFKDGHFEPMGQQDVCTAQTRYPGANNTDVTFRGGCVEVSHRGV